MQCKYLGYWPLHDVRSYILYSFAEFQTDWKQSNEEIEISIRVDFLSFGVKEPDDIDVTFSDTDVVIGFPSKFLIFLIEV